MSLLLVTTFPHTFICSFVLQDPFFVSVVYSCLMFIVHYVYGLGSNLIPIFLLSIAGAFIGYFLQRFTTCAVFVSRFKLDARINIVFIVKLLLLFAAYFIFESYGPTPWSLPLLFVAVMVITILAWFTSRDELVMVLLEDGKTNGTFTGNTYVEKSFRNHIQTPAVWLLISIFVISVLNLLWILVLAGFTWVTPLRVQCLVVIGSLIVVICCAVILNYSGEDKKKCVKK